MSNEWNTLTCDLEDGDTVLGLFVNVHKNALEYCIMTYCNPPCDGYDCDPHWKDGRKTYFPLEFLRYWTHLPQIPTDTQTVISIHEGSIEVKQVEVSRVR
jgi:hypothetical protein